MLARIVCCILIVGLGLRLGLAGEGVLGASSGAVSDAPASAATGVATLAGTDVAPTAADWGAVRRPSEGPARAIGRYGGGCLTGAERLPERGAGYFVTRPERGRVFGHPTMIALIEALGARLITAGQKALPIGDVSQPRGGPAPTGHASHQTGLDVDVWYEAPRAGGQPISLVDLAHKRLTSHYSAAVARVLTIVVADARVDRLFVNPVIKQALCATKGPHEWLHKVRPWWGHHDHFHVRMACPADSPACEPQAPLPDGDGCGELAWWLRDSAASNNERKSYQARVGATPPLPAPCLELVRGP